LQYRGKTELINGTASGGIVGGLIGLRGMYIVHVCSLCCNKRLNVNVNGSSLSYDGLSIQTDRSSFVGGEFYGT